jgi:hypothetical protein
MRCLIMNHFRGLIHEEEPQRALRALFWSRDHEEQLLGVVNGLGRDLGVKRESTGTYNPE